MGAERGRRVSVSTTGLLIAIVLLVAAGPSAAAQQLTRHAMRGMVLTVDAVAKRVVISHDAVAGVMPAMAMPFDVRDAKELNGLVPGANVSFTLVVGKESSHIERVQVVRDASVEQDPLTARRLRLLQTIGGTAPPALAVGQAVPDFTLIDQAHQRVSLSQLRGKVVAINFIYTSCVLPQFCYRLANHFATISKRFKERMGRDLVLLTVTFDPARDTPERLAEYSRQWNADAAAWHFLTGESADIAKVGSAFGVDYFPDEGLMSHSSRTAIVDRRGLVAASIEGNQYTAAQLGDLVGTVLGR